jgi:hypothetical protein
MNNVGAMFKTGTSVADTGRTTERERDRSRSPHLA